MAHKQRGQQWRQTVKERNQCLRPTVVEMLMHKPDTYLMRMHASTGPEWFVMPGGRVLSDDAAKIIARPDVAPDDNGLFSWDQALLEIGAVKAVNRHAFGTPCHG
jgi:hypothetical protein